MSRGGRRKRRQTTYAHFDFDAFLQMAHALPQEKEILVNPQTMDKLVQYLMALFPTGPVGPPVTIFGKKVVVTESVPPL